MTLHGSNSLSYLAEEKEMEAHLWEQCDLSEAQCVLGVGCRTGAWLLSQAKKYPHVQFIGIDEHEEWVAVASEQAGRDRVKNATFLVRDLGHIEGGSFPCVTFDVVNVAFLADHLLTLDYAALARSLFVLCRSGGRLSWLEGELPITTSPAFEALTAQTCQALQAMGQSFIPADLQEIAAVFALQQSRVLSERRNLGMTPMLGNWLRKAGYQSINSTPYAIEISVDAKAYPAFLQHVLAYRQPIKSLLMNTGVITESAFEDVFTQMQAELQGATFCGIWWLLQVCGRKP